jgi:hypothetical protein
MPGIDSEHVAAATENPEIGVFIRSEFSGMDMVNVAFVQG